MFIQKRDEDGNLIWSKSVGGIGYDFVSTIEIDNSGYIYIAGNFRDTVDFDLGPGVSNLVSQGDRDVFILKLDNNGDLIWAKGIGGPGVESAHGLKMMDHQMYILEELGNQE